MVDVLSHGIVAQQLRNYELSSLSKLTNLEILIVLSCPICFKLRFFNLFLFKKQFNFFLFVAHQGRMSSERYCHTPGVVVVVVVVVGVGVGVDNFRLKFLFINLSQVKVSVY